MIGYLDTSALVPLLIAEPTSDACRRLWRDADRIVSSRLLYVQAAAALAQALRMDRITRDEHSEALLRLDEMWSAVDVAEADEEVIHTAAVFAHTFALRGYDAVHCASAVGAADDDVVAASGDQKLLAAWTSLGLATLDPHVQPDAAAGDDIATRDTN